MTGHYHLTQYIKSVGNARATWQEMHYLYLFHHNLARATAYKLYITSPLIQPLTTLTIDLYYCLYSHVSFIITLRLFILFSLW